MSKTNAELTEELHQATKALASRNNELQVVKPALQSAQQEIVRLEGLLDSRDHRGSGGPDLSMLAASLMGKYLEKVALSGEGAAQNLMSCALRATRDASLILALDQLEGFSDMAPLEIVDAATSDPLCVALMATRKRAADEQAGTSRIERPPLALGGEYRPVHATPGPQSPVGSVAGMKPLPATIEVTPQDPRR